MECVGSRIERPMEGSKILIRLGMLAPGGLEEQFRAAGEGVDGMNGVQVVDSTGVVWG